jgi:hypothetical protein
MCGDAGFGRFRVYDVGRPGSAFKGICSPSPRQLIDIPLWGIGINLSYIPIEGIGISLQIRRPNNPGRAELTHLAPLAGEAISV